MEFCLVLSHEDAAIIQ